MISNVDFLKNVQNFDVEFSEKINIETATELEAQIEVLKQEKQQLIAEVTALNEEIAENQEQIEEKERRIAELETQIEILNAQIAELEQDVTEAFEDGRKAEHDLLWDNIQNNGERTIYNNAFQFWHSEAFYPKYDIKPTKMASIFEDFDAEKIWNPTLDLVERLNSLGLTFDTSECTNWTSAFFRCSMARIGIINAKKAISPFNSVFYGYYGHTIDKLILPDNVDAVYGNIFVWAHNLKNIIIEGIIGGKNITEFDLAMSPLSKSSIISFINALSDITTNKSIKFKASAVNTAFETSEGAKDGSTSEEWLDLIATKSNWTISLA